MLRVLMVLEDYGELMFLQTVLKKMGFDVDAIQSVRAFNDSLLRMNPDILVMTGQGKKVKGLELAAGVKRTRGLPHVILIRSAGAPRLVSDHVDAWLESPVAALQLLNVIAEVAGLNKDVLAEKFSKLRIQVDAANGEHRVLNIPEDEVVEEDLEKAEVSSGNFGTLQDSTVTPGERKERYQKFLDEKRPDHIGFSIKQVQEQVKTLRKDELDADLDELEKQRKAFVEHLFSKKKP